MSWCDARWLRRCLTAGLGLAVVGSCTPDVNFVPDPKVEHCANELFDDDLGETDTDCGGPECRACELGGSCLETADCIEGMCIEGFCQAAGCDNGARDEGETDVDCGGSCKKCDPGQGCEDAGDCASTVCTNGMCVAPTCNDGVINGTETGRDCGGGVCPDGCGTGSPCNENTDCFSQRCVGEPGSRRCEVMCLEGSAECDGNIATIDDECETNLLTDPNHCGECGAVCDLPHTSQSCVSGTCQIGGCDANYDDCDNDVETGCETNLRNNELHCGACGNECSDDNGTPTCTAAECQIECDEGFEDCDDDRSNGCERSVSSDVEACGGCTNVCPIVPGETPWCREGVCGGTPCPAGMGNCDGIGDTCEKDLTTDIAHCGRCGGVCTVRNGTPRCNASTCAVGTCDDGWDNCDTTAADGGYADGCETNTDVDVMNCGACGNDCTVAHGMATCVNGGCRVMSCDAGWFNCDSGASDGGYANGCETNIAADKLNCGQCGLSCDAAFASGNATGRCVSSRCELEQCLTNFGDCDTNANNCESDFRTDEGDCGRCGTVCSPTGTTGTPGNECLAGTCNPTCGANFLTCDSNPNNGCEADRRSDESNCGGCGIECEAVNGTNTCNASACVPTCSATHRTCDGNPNNGCETAVTGAGNETHCGGCAATNTTCTTAGASSTSCNASGVCVPVCQSLRGDCDSEPWDGCETSYASNNSHCGACNRACQTGTGTPTFVSANTCSTGGVCQPVCVAGRGDCDSMPWNGCEANIASDTRCGSCSRDCAGTACGSSGETSCCVGSGASYSCQAQITTVNDVDPAPVAAATMSFMHALQPCMTAGCNRLILLAIAAESTPPGSTWNTAADALAASRPETVTYGNTAMTLAASQSGGTAYWSPELYIYYLTESGIGSKTGPQTVAINGNPAPVPIQIQANLVQYQGVNQSTPLATNAAWGGNAAGSIMQTVGVTTAGSRIYSLVASLWSGVPSITVTSSPTITHMLTSSGSTLNGGGTDMRVLAAYIGSGAATSLAAQDYALTWTFPSASVLTHLAVAIRPAQMP